MEHVLAAIDITKRYPGGVVANDQVSFDLLPGEVHAVVGENGAGKTTLMKILAGLLAPDSGSILVRGQEVSMRGPVDAYRLGIGMVHQHLMLIPRFTVAENIALGAEPRRGLNIDRAAIRAWVKDLSHQYGLAVDPDAIVKNLSIGEKQRVEIIKVMYRKADVIILDEPTAVLSPGEVDNLFSVIRLLCRAGKSVVFVSHKLPEVIEIADRITVLAKGRVVGTVSRGQVDVQALGEMITGSGSPDFGTARSGAARSVTAGPAVGGSGAIGSAAAAGSSERGSVAPGSAAAGGEASSARLSRHDRQAGDVILRITGLRARAASSEAEVLKGATLELRSGEILGIAGVEGNGQAELVDVILGLLRPNAGEVSILGRDVTRMSPRSIRDLGVALIPDDRHEKGLLLGFPAWENMMLGYETSDTRIQRGGVLNISAALSRAKELARTFNLTPANVYAPASSFSGGNQQKMILARELSSTLRLVVAAQPTRGLDVGSTAFVHSKIVEKRDAGAGVLLISFDLDEILSLSDRIAVMYDGRVVATMCNDGKVTKERLGLLMTGLGDREGVA
ncbi:MAG TPA: ABC transporter ATP-binding protein [Firmicutes bacterium]|nr:ABC transporter ATP-binding protein [Bacillota bacterium]